MSWFEVDRAGLRQLWGEKDKRFLLFELIANALDEPGVTKCDVVTKPIEGKRQYRIVVEDDAPEGFVDLKHAYTLFAPTRKRKNANVRGRFNIGEKHVLALAESASIHTTKGMVSFGPKGRKFHPRTKRTRGSVIIVNVKLTMKEHEGMLTAVRSIATPEGIKLTVNGERVPYREPVAKIRTALLTELEKDGVCRPSVRITDVFLYEPRGDEQPMIFEMGIPVMPIEDRWHIDVQQKIPLTIERDNVKPSFLRDIRAEVLNRMAEKLTEDDVAEKWVRDGMSDDRIELEAVNVIATKRWGENRVVVAPGDTRSREQAVLNGYTIVNPREMSKEEWEQVRKSEAVPSGKDLWKQDLTGCRVLSTDEWTGGMLWVAALTRHVATLMGFKVKVLMIEAPEADIRADYGSRTVRFNIPVLGKSWFNRSRVTVLELIIHELAHEYGGHLDRTYLEGLCRIGARLAVADLGDFE